MSNFTTAHLTELVGACSIRPVINQARRRSRMRARARPCCAYQESRRRWGLDVVFGRQIQRNEISHVRENWWQNSQIELHPKLQQRSLVALCNNLGVVVEAYSPLGAVRGASISQGAEQR